jgi:hypothetical protein
MLPTPEELRDESRLCRKAAEDVADIETRSRLDKDGFLLALLGEVAERGRLGKSAVVLDPLPAR